MAVVVTRFESWLETVGALVEKRGSVLEPDDIPFFMSLYREDLDPEQAVEKASCL